MINNSVYDARNGSLHCAEWYHTLRGMVTHIARNGNMHCARNGDPHCARNVDPHCARNVNPQSAHCLVRHCHSYMFLINFNSPIKVGYAISCILFAISDRLNPLHKILGPRALQISDLLCDRAASEELDAKCV